MSSTHKKQGIKVSTTKKKILLKKKCKREQQYVPTVLVNYQYVLSGALCFVSVVRSVRSTCAVHASWKEDVLCTYVRTYTVLFLMNSERWAVRTTIE